MTLSRVFTLVVDGRPTLAFEAANTRQAQQIYKENWLKEDLAFLRSNGVPLGTARSKLSVRPATSEEAIAYDRVAESTEPSDEMVLVYLVDLDGVGKPS
jgi:hypothetical protein